MRSLVSFLQLQEVWNTHRESKNRIVYHLRSIVGIATWRRLINQAQDVISLYNITEHKCGPLYVCLSINILFSSFCFFLQNIGFSSMHVVARYCAYNSIMLLKFGKFPTALVSSLWNLKTLELYVLSFEVMMWFIILQLSLPTRGWEIYIICKLNCLVVFPGAMLGSKLKMLNLSLPSCMLPALSLLARSL